MIILIGHGGDGSHSLVLPEVQYGWELGGHSNQDGLYVDNAPLAFIVVFHQASPKPGGSTSFRSATSRTLIELKEFMQRSINFEGGNFFPLKDLVQYF